MVKPPEISSNKKKETKEEYIDQQTTVVLHGAENIINFLLPKYSTIKENVDNCYDYLGPSVVAESKPIWKEILKLDKRGIKIRFLTDMRKDNISYCKQFQILKHFEMRHLDGVKGNFGIADRQNYFAHASNKEGGPVTHAIFSTVEGIVHAQQYLFDSLWREAIPAEVRIKEIEQGILPDTIETLKEPSEIINLTYKLVKSAKSEILLIFHTANALLRQKRSGGIDLIAENATKHNTHSRILVPLEDQIADTIHEIEGISGIEIRSIEPIMQTGITILVVDRKYSLVVELKDDTKENIQEAIGLATYSNSKSTVLSYVSIFEALWKQSELYEELKSHSTAQKDFINIAAHELRNPIQPILGLSDVLLQSNTTFVSIQNDRIRQKEIIEIIARNARRLQRLTEDILDVTRIEGRTLNLNMESFVLSKIVDEMVKDYTVESRNNRTNITFHLFTSKEVEPISVLADKNRIKQVIANLIDNSIKFTENGSITITVDINNKHDHVIVRIKDTGVGIDLSILPKLFSKFVTRSEKGTGLGLYICKGIIEAHGGQIWAENNPERGIDGIDGHGAIFGFSLPLS